MLRVISDFSLWALIEDSKQYRMILYADAKYRVRMESLLKLIDVQLDYQVSEENESDYRSVYDLVYEDKDQIMVIVAKENFAVAEKILNEIGFQLGVHFKNIERYSQEINLLPYYYDPLLGYNLGTKNKDTAGFCIYGDMQNAKFHILTLGGSTTDPSIYPFKCWSECLHDLLEEAGLSNAVICGGVAGYTSAEELFKLIRDGFSLKPDIVLNYSGGNDMQVEEEYPYINFYMREIGEYLVQKKDMTGLNFDSHGFGISYGINSFTDGNLLEKCNFWLDNQKMIHTVCQSRNVRHMTFWQPSLFNDTKPLSAQERSYQLNLVYIGVKREHKSRYADKSQNFACLVRDAIEKYEWIYDLTGIFGNESVYIDFAHVNEQGNKIIAEYVANIIYENLEEWEAY